MAKKKKDPASDNSKETGKKGGSKLLLIIIVLLLLVIAGGAGAFFLLYSAPSDEEIAKEIQKDETPKVSSSEEPQIGITIELKPFIVNLADPKASHFLKATITLEVKDDKTKDLTEKMLPKIRNDILLLLSSQTLEDVISIEGKVRLRDEIIARVSRIIGRGRLKNVYFSQFVVQ